MTGMYDLNDKKRRPQAKKNKLITPRKPLAERVPLRKLVRLFALVVSVIFVLFLGVEIYTLVFKVALLKLEKIEVANAQRVAKEEIIAAAGVKPGDDMLRLNLKKIGEQIEKSPWVDAVRVRRYFPHTLAIEVTEREPVAIVNMGYLYYLDRRGEIFKPLTAGDRLDYPVLTGVDEAMLTKDPKEGKALLETAVAIVALLESGTVFKSQDISEIHVDEDMEFTLVTTTGGVAVNLGKEGFMQKLQRLARIYKDLQPQLGALSYIDLDYHDRIVIKRG